MWRNLDSFIPLNRVFTAGSLLPHDALLLPEHALLPEWESRLLQRQTY